MVVLPFQAPRNLQGASPAQRLASQHGQRLAHYQELRDFYAGVHFPAARRGRSNLVVNYARAIVDKHLAYTFARGLSFQDPASPEAPRHSRMEADLAQILEAAAFTRTLRQAANSDDVQALDAP